MKEEIGICVGCITDDDWTRKPITGNVGHYRDEQLGFCDSHAD